MFQRYLRMVTRFGWLVIAAWLCLALAVGLWFPRLQSVVSHQSTTFIPDSDPIVTAHRLANRVDPQHKAQSTLIVAIRDPHGLTAQEERFLEDALQRVDAQRTAYHVNWVQDAANSDPDVAKQLRSSDDTTEIAMIGLPSDVTDPHLPQILSRLREAFRNPPAGSHVYFTGDVAIQEDDIQLSQQGADKTAIVTVVLVLVILLAVFRSVMAPMVTLVSIGLSYFVASGFVALAAEHGLPVSTFTQTFLVATLFGAGTDYSIILLNRFREELMRTHDKAEALANTLRGVGKTVTYSAMTVLVSFAVLYLAKFGLYRSAVGVSIGIFITLLMCLTFIPALAATFGGALFWPRRPVPGMEHRPSRFWGMTGRVATRYPWRIVMALLVVLAPIALLFSNKRSFDPMQDIPMAPSVQGFRQIAHSFGEGRVLPVQVVLETPDNLRTPEGLATIDHISSALAAARDVQEVDSATQPLGKPISSFRLANQNQAAAAGLAKVANGLKQLSAQLDKGSRAAQRGTKALESLHQGALQLAQGAGQVAAGQQSLATHTSTLAASAEKLANGAMTLERGVSRVQRSVQQMQAGSGQLQHGLSQAAASAHQLAQGSGKLAAAQTQLATGAKALADALAAWAAAHPADAGDPNWRQIMVLAQQLQAGTTAAAQSSRQVAQGNQQMATALDRLSAGSAGLNNGIGQLATATGQLAAGAGQLSAGMGEFAQGTHKLATGEQQLAAGAKQVAGGSWQVADGIAQYADASRPMVNGLSQAGRGAARLHDGVVQVRSFLIKTVTSEHQGDPGFYVPADVIEKNKRLQQAMDAYISPDGHTAKFTVVLNQNPYSLRAISDVPYLKQAAEAALSTSPVHTGQVYLAGTTAEQAEMNRLSSGDLFRSLSLIFVAIFLLLVLMLRSLLTPLYIMMSLAATYFVTMGIVQELTVHVLKHPAVSWAVPFFVFLLLVALGVDYSIFLMSRFDEEMKGGLAPVDAMRRSMQQMGNVILSAAIIMAGTFGSLLVTGLTTIEEIGLSVIVGLLLYTVCLLAFFVPACAAIIGSAHGWPFQTNRPQEPVATPRAGLPAETL